MHPTFSLLLQCKLWQHSAHSQTYIQFKPNNCYSEFHFVWTISIPCKNKVYEKMECFCGEIIKGLLLKLHTLKSSLLASASLCLFSLTHSLSLFLSLSLSLPLLCNISVLCTHTHHTQTQTHTLIHTRTYTKTHIHSELFLFGLPGVLWAVSMPCKIKCIFKLAWINFSLMKCESATWNIKFCCLKFCLLKWSPLVEEWKSLSLSHKAAYIVKRQQQKPNTCYLDWLELY